ncbi:MAG: hypothetical protein QME81_07000 [bacterium]|nr:hypothetical protein [bacterium]
MIRFLKQVNELELPSHITVTPSYLTESKVSGPVEFNVANYLKEMIEVVENQEDILGRVNVDPGKRVSGFSSTISNSWVASGERSPCRIKGMPFVTYSTVRGKSSKAP